MKVITPLLSVLVLGSISVLGSSEHPPDELARDMVCRFKCGNLFYYEECWQSCYSDPRKIPVLDVEAEVRDKLVCISSLNTPVLSSQFDPKIFIQEIRNQTSDWDDTRATFIGFGFSYYRYQEEVSPGRYELRYTRVFPEGISRSEIKGLTVPEPDGEPTRSLDIWMQCVTLEMEVLDDSPPSFTVEMGFKPAVENPYCTYWLGCEQDGGNRTSPQMISLENMPQGTVTFRNLSLVKNLTVTVDLEGHQFPDPFTRTLPYDTFQFSIPQIQEGFKTIGLCVPNELEDLKAVITHKKTHIYDVQVTWRKPDYTPDFFIVNITSNSEEFDGNLVTPHNVSGIDTQTIFRDVNIPQHFNVSIRGWSALGGGPVTSKSFTVPDGNDVSGSDIIIITATLASATLLVATGVSIYLIRRRRKRGQRRRNKDEIDPDRLTMTRVLGSGAFGVVKFGKLREDNGQVIDVAVKMLRDDTNKTELSNFRLEIEMMKSLGKHPNIVSFVGYRTTGLYPFLVVEYCPRGDLLSFLRSTSLETKTTAVDEKDDRHVSAPGLCARETTPKENSEGSEYVDTYIDTVVANQGPTVTVLDMLNFGRQIAAGMEFLSSKRIVHRDLAARNILVCDRGVVKISDFGMSRDIYQENVYRKTGNGRMPFKWMAIESLIHQVYTTQSDVWSFGILLWEIFTLGHTPYLDIPTLEILKRLQSGYRMERPEICTQALYEVMLSCWKLKPKDRPSFTLLRKQLDQLIGMTAEHQYLDADYVFAGMQLEEDSQTSSPRDTPIPLQETLAVSLEPEIIHEDVELPCVETKVCVEV